MQIKRLIHSFARPRNGETRSESLDRALAILKMIRSIGLVLAPEVIEWDLSPLGYDDHPLRILQRRICFTEIATTELANHSQIFGPLALSFNVTQLREVGAMPVIYAPQGLSSPLSQIALFCVNGVHHTKSILQKLQELRETSDSEFSPKKFGATMTPDCQINLQNSDSAGNIVASCSISSLNIQKLLQYVCFNSIPFDHSIGVLNIFLNIFYPTDNRYRDDILGYYRQREWRLIAGDILFNGRPLGRELSDAEKAEIVSIDPIFWNQQLSFNGKDASRADWATVYEPINDWNAFNFIEAIYAPREAHNQIKEIVGDAIQIHAHP